MTYNPVRNEVGTGEVGGAAEDSLGGARCRSPSFPICDHFMKIIFELFGIGPLREQSASATLQCP